MPEKLSRDPEGHQSAPPSHSIRSPEPRWLLSRVYIGRLGIATAFLLRALLDSGADSLFPVALAILLITGTYTGAAFLYSRRPGRPIVESFIYSQVVFDAALVTAIVYLTGGPYSLFAPLYVLVIFAAALLLPILGGMLVGMLAIVLYFASAVSISGTLTGTVVLQIVLFAVVALVTGYLGDRLRQTGTELGEVRSELRQLQLDTSDILGTISTGVLTVDGQGRLAYLNPAAEELLGMSYQEWQGRPVLAHLDEIAPGLGRVIARSTAEHQPIRRFETEPLDGGAFVLGVSTTLVEREMEGPPAVTAIFQDITEKMRVEGLRRRAERLEAVAELSASLAHEIKNPLASIRSAVEQLALEDVDTEDREVLRGLVIRESDRLSRLLTEFIDFARVKLEAPQPVDLPRVVQHVLELVRSHPEAEDRSLEVSIEESEAGLWLRGAEDLMHRAVLNLVLNAVQWAGRGGRVELRLDELHSDLLSPAQGDLRLLRLRVADSGPGVPPEIREQIFNPFFTRRPGGTGLGLALVQRAVEAHGGAVFVDNAPDGQGSGAVFTLYLPAIPSETGESSISPAFNNRARRE